MSSKKEKSPREIKEEEIAQEEQTQESTPVPVEENIPGMDELQKTLEEAQAQSAEYKDGWQRTLADFQNYKRRTDAEKADTYRMAVGSIVKRYLPILDDLERALAARPADQPWADGIELIYRKLQNILDNEGVKRIEAEGQMFDPNLHEAVVQEVAEDVESGHVIAVIQNGYMIGDRVIRPAQVRVAQ